MEYAIQLFLPVIGGLMLGNWLNQAYGLPPIWTVILGILGLAGGIGILYKRTAANQNIPRYVLKTKNQSEPTKSGQSVQDLDALYKKLHEEPDTDDFEADYPDWEKDPSQPPISTPKPLNAPDLNPDDPHAKP